jgi:hypothetical protein
MQRLKFACICLLVVALAAPLGAYTIYLRDGSTLIAKEKYRIEDGKALIVLQNGTQTFIDAAEIDVEKTERVNRGNYGTAFFIDDEGHVIEAPVTPQEKQTLTDLAGRADTTTSNRSLATRPPADAAEMVDRPKTKGGFVDLTVAPRTPYRDLDISVEISRFLRTLGLSEFKVYQGTAPQRVFLEMTTNSEATVFRSLEAAADTLVHLRNQFPEQVQLLEVLFLTSNRERAGQFLLDGELAALLGDKSTETSAFFIANVEF